MDTLLEYGLFAVFLALILTPFGLPIPEDVSLLAGGALARLGHATYPQVLVVGFTGVIGGDVIAWTFGRRVGLHPRGWIARLVGRDDIERIERFYRRYGSWTIVIARQFPGMRLPAFFFAGASGVPLRRFLLFDCSAALVTVGVFPALGYTFADDLSQVLQVMDNFRFWGTLVLTVVVAFVAFRVGRRLYRRRQRRRLDPDAEHTGENTGSLSEHTGGRG